MLPGSLHALKAAIPRSLLERSEVRAWVTFARSLALVCISTLLLIAWNRAPIQRELGALGWPVWVLGWLGCGVCWAGLFVLGHECGHGSFSKHQRINSIVGALCLLPSFTGFHTWRTSHALHHSQVANRGLDPDWTQEFLTREELNGVSLTRKLRWALGLRTPLGILLGFWVGIAKRRLDCYFPASTVPSGTRRKLQFEAFLSLAHLALLLALGRVFGFTTLLQVHLIPMLVSAASGALLTLLHHSRAGAKVWERDNWSRLQGILEATYDVRLPRVLEWVWLNVNLHVPHHINASIPWYHLPQASAALRQAYPGLAPSEPFSLQLLWTLWKNPTLHRDGQALVVGVHGG
ncbi:MAG: fatty acid desaturase [Polyangiaceae bacterium]|nr:fatty acid desaturase [Polyangiaceae bacterium]